MYIVKYLFLQVHMHQSVIEGLFDEFKIKNFNFFQVQMAGADKNRITTN